VAVLALGCGRRASAVDAGAAAGAARVSVVRPDDLRGWVRVEAPQATAEALGALVGARVSAEMALAMGLGVELAMLAVVDATRPVEVALVGAESAPRVVFALRPRSAGEARAVLRGRYRLVVDARVGERIERAEDAGRMGLACALVVTDDAPGSRLVCAPDAETLVRVGPWLAVRGLGDEGGDAGALRGVRAWLGPAVLGRMLAGLRPVVRDASRELEASAAAARRAREAPPDYGDPEEAARALGEALGPWVDGLSAVTALAADFDVRAEGLQGRLVADLGASSTGRLAEALGARVGRSVAGATATGALPADAVLMAVDRSDPDAQRQWLTDAAATAVRVLGARVPDPVAARRDLGEMVREVDGVSALAASLDPDGSLEWTVLLPQRDDGSAARRALARLGAAPWLRGMRLGGPLRVTTTGGGLTLSGGAAVGAADAGVARPPASLRVEVTPAGLAAVMGTRAAGSMEALRARAERDRMDDAAGAATAADALGAELGLRLRVTRAATLRAELGVTLSARAVALVRERLGEGRRVRGR
jgi:hypothetical protein